MASPSKTWTVQDDIKTERSDPAHAPFYYSKGPPYKMEMSAGDRRLYELAGAAAVLVVILMVAAVVAVVVV